MKYGNIKEGELREIIEGVFNEPQRSSHERWNDMFSNPEFDKAMKEYVEKENEKRKIACVARKPNSSLHSAMAIRKSLKDGK